MPPEPDAKQPEPARPPETASPLDQESLPAVQGAAKPGAASSREATTPHRPRPPRGLSRPREPGEPPRPTAGGAPRPPKDWWDRADIIGKLLLPVALVVLGLVANGQLEGIKQQLKASERDIDVLMKFNQVYYGAESRVLSPHFVEVISSKTVRAHLRYFIFWDALNNNVSSDFKFDPSLRDWHTLGEVVQRHVWDSPDNELEFWKQAMKDSFDQWPQHKPELARLFDWVYRTYRLPDAFSLQPPGKNTQK